MNPSMNPSSAKSAQRDGKHAALRSTMVCLPVVLAAILTGCGRSAAASSDPPAGRQRVEEASDSSLVTVVQPERFELVDVSTRRVADRLSGTCTVSADVSRTVPVNALVGGRVVDLRVRLGDVVHKGEPLVTIQSPDLASAFADQLKAAADQALAREQLDRSHVLFDHGSIARKDLELAEDAEQKALIDVHTTQDRVRMLGGDPSHPSASIELRAPIDGTVIEQNVVAAAGVKSPDNAPDLLTIADLSRVWVLCDVYENEIAGAHVGAPARIHLTAYPDRSFSGRIGNVSQVLDSNTRTAKARIEMDNAAGVMRPGMFAVAELESSGPRDRLVVPTTALMQMHGAEWVFVSTGAGEFRRVQVQSAGEVAPGLEEITAGVTVKQRVVRNALEFVQALEQ